MKSRETIPLNKTWECSFNICTEDSFLFSTKENEDPDHDWIKRSPPTLTQLIAIRQKKSDLDSNTLNQEKAQGYSRLFPGTRGKVPVCFLNCLKGGIPRCIDSVRVLDNTLSLISCFYSDFELFACKSF
jgi:hypothetical protein